MEWPVRIIPSRINPGE